jgi:hypothetical protein
MYLCNFSDTGNGRWGEDSYHYSGEGEGWCGAGHYEDVNGDGHGDGWIGDGYGAGRTHISTLGPDDDDPIVPPRQLLMFPVLQRRIEDVLGV